MWMVESSHTSGGRGVGGKELTSLPFTTGSRTSNGSHSGSNQDGDWPWVQEWSLDHREKQLARSGKVLRLKHMEC